MEEMFSNICSHYDSICMDTIRSSLEKSNNRLRTIQTSEEKFAGADIGAFLPAELDQEIFSYFTKIQIIISRLRDRHEKEEEHSNALIVEEVIDLVSELLSRVARLK